MLAEKRVEVDRLRGRYGDWAPPAGAPPRRDFAAALRGPGVSLIAEFKRRSPSRGEIRPEADPAEIALMYEQAGAAAMSVLTDEEFFGGTLGDLASARAAVKLPVLRKDFIIDRCQIAESAGESDRRRWAEALGGLAAQCGQAALVEVHDAAELERALESGAEIIGINNRDLQIFEVSLETTLKLRPRVPEGLLVVSESGIRTADDVRRLAEAGVDGMLVGEALMGAEDPAGKIEELLAGT